MIPFLVVALLFLAAAGFLILKKRKVDAPVKPAGKEDAKELTPEEKQRLAEQRNAALKLLKVPGNFPRGIPIYFGSQTGTAEKFAKELDDES